MMPLGIRNESRSVASGKMGKLPQKALSANGARAITLPSDLTPAILPASVTGQWQAASGDIERHGAGNADLPSVVLDSGWRLGAGSGAIGLTMR